MNDNRIPIINPGYTVEKFDGESLLYNETGTQGVYLNDSAYAVWLLCGQQITVAQMVEYLEEIYPDKTGRIKDDVLSALETLHAHGVITFTNE
jgi:hypothetical protein